MGLLTLHHTRSAGFFVRLEPLILSRAVFAMGLGPRLEERQGHRRRVLGLLQRFFSPGGDSARTDDSFVAIKAFILKLSNPNYKVFL
jgi:hypothetical protein